MRTHVHAKPVHSRPREKHGLLRSPEASHQVDLAKLHLRRTKVWQVQSHSFYTMNSSRIKIPFQELAIATATAQISSLVFCLAWSIKFNFHESTATHCRVDNYLPSLSATLDFTPQRDVWRAFIGLTSPPRYFIAYLYYRIIFRSKILLFLHWLEVTALIGLSMVDSMRYFGK